jgi:hypothetical protein
MKVCPHCGENKPTTEYYVKNKVTGQLQSWCKKCHREHRQGHYRQNLKAYADKRERNQAKARARNRSYLAEYLRNNPCVDCGEADIEVLQFDHVEPLQDTRARRVGGYDTGSLETLQREIAKCEIRCANCHLRRTRRMQGWSYEIKAE